MAEIDSLSIELTANTSSAEKSIQRVIDMLRMLNAAAIDAPSQSRAIQSIRSIAKAAREIDNDAGQKLARLAGGLSAMAKVGDLSNLKDAGKNLSSVIRAVNDLGSASSGNLDGLAHGIEHAGRAFDSIKDADTSKLREIQDALSGETSGPLHSSSRTGNESAELGGTSTSGGMLALPAFDIMAANIRDATAAFREFLGITGNGIPPIFTEFVEEVQTAKNEVLELGRLIIGLLTSGPKISGLLGGGINWEPGRNEEVFWRSNYTRMLNDVPNFTMGDMGLDKSNAIEIEDLGEKAAEAAQRFNNLGEAAEGMSEKVREATDQAVPLDAEHVNEKWLTFNDILDNVSTSIRGFVGNITNSATGAFSALGGVLGVVGHGLGTVTKGLAAIPVFFSGALVGKIQNATKSVLGFFNQIKRVAMYRAIRSAIKFITQGFQEGLKNLYSWSSAVNNEFARSMNTLSTASHYAGNSIAAMAAPLINALAPAIDFVVDKLVDMFNLFNQIMARLAGQTSYIAAKKVATQWGDAASSASGSAKKAADDIKRTILGFDEINKLNDAASSGGSGGGGGGGGGASGAGMFETRQIEGSVSNFADSLKAAFLDGNWQELGTTLGNKINELVENLEKDKWFSKAGEKVGYYINGWFSTKYWTLDTINFTNIGSKIAEFLNNAIEKINFGTIGALMVKKMTIIGDAAIGFFTNFDWGQAGTKLSDFVKGLYDELKKWLDTHDWSEIGATIAEKILDFASNVDTVGIANSICDFLTTAINDGIALVQSFVIKLVIEPVVTNVQKIVNAINGNGNVDWKDISALLKSLALGTSLFLAATGNYSGAVVALGVALMIEPIVNSVSTIVNQLKNDGGIAWDEVIKIVRTLAFSAGLFLLTKGNLPAGVAVLGVALLIEPVVNGVRNIVNELKNDGGIAWDEVIKIARTLAFSAGVFLMTKGNIPAGAAVLGVALLIEPVVNGVRNIVNELKGDGGIAWDEVIKIARLLAFSAGLFLLTKNPIAGVAVLGVAFAIEPVVNGVRAIVNEVKGDGSIAWDEVIKIARMLAFNAGLFLLTKGNVPAGLAVLGVSFAIEPVVNEISDIVSDVKTNGLTWENFKKILSDSLLGLGLALLIGANPVGGWVVLTIGVTLKLEIVDTFFEGVAEGAQNIWGAITGEKTWSEVFGPGDDTSSDPYTIPLTLPVEPVLGPAGESNFSLPSKEELAELGYVLPIQVEVETNPTDLATTFKEKWDGLNKDNKLVDFFGKIGSTVKQVFDPFKSLWDGTSEKDKKVSVPVGTVMSSALKSAGSIAKYALGHYMGSTNVDVPVGAKKGDNLVGTTISKLANNRWLGSTVSYVGTGAKKAGNLTGTTISKMAANKWLGSTVSYVGTAAKKAGNLVGTSISKLASILWTGSTISEVGAGVVKGGNLTGTTVSDVVNNSWKGTTVPNVGVNVSKTFSESVADHIGVPKNVTITAELVKKPYNKISWTAYNKYGNTVEIAKSGGVINSNGIKRFASGGSTGVHGTMFLAGEAGPEIVGHVGGRSEVLNKSQLAATMYAAVRAAMAPASANFAAAAQYMYNGGAGSDYDADTELLMDLVRAGSDATQRQNELLRQQNELLRQINDKEFATNISTADINRAQVRKNRRAGTTIVPIGT